MTNRLHIQLPGHPAGLSQGMQMDLNALMPRLRSAEAIKRKTT